MGNCKWICISDRPLASPTLTFTKKFDFADDKIQRFEDEYGEKKDNNGVKQANGKPKVQEKQKEIDTMCEVQSYTYQKTEAFTEENLYKVEVLEFRSVKDIAAELDIFYSRRKHDSTHNVQEIDLKGNRTKGKQADF